MRALNSQEEVESDPLESGSGFVSIIHQQHARLRGLGAELRIACSRPWAEAHDEFLARLGRRLETFHAELLAHFDGEERDGYHLEVVQERPELASQVTALLDEHAAIRTELGAIVVVEPSPELMARVLEILDVLDGHEQRENALLQYATLTDLGG